MHERTQWHHRIAPILAGLLWIAPAVTATASAAERPPQGVPVVLWPDGAPNAVGKEDVDIPTLTPYWPDTPVATGTAVVVCPGGSYTHLAMDHEGQQVALWLNKLGVPAFVLKYRLGDRYHHPTMLWDAQRAIRYVRSHAAEFNIRADRLGIMGFSAGGHLASSTGTHFDQGKPDASDPIERVGSRPDFMILAYPVISMIEPFSHKGSRDHLLGPSPDPKLLELMSNERQVTPQTPPTFIFQTDDDQTVPVENAVAFFTALKKAGVPAELHIYQHGKHGVGLAKDDPILWNWPDRVADWLRVRELLPSAGPMPSASPMH
jgi:acetyl esterase/lipase